MKLQRNLLDALFYQFIQFSTKYVLSIPEHCDKQTSMEETLTDVSEGIDGQLKGPPLKQKMCPMCNRAFNDTSNLKRHITSHSKKRISTHAEPIIVPARRDDGFFHCPYCEKEVRDGSNIRRHIRNKHKTKNRIEEKVKSS